MSLSNLFLVLCMLLCVQGRDIPDTTEGIHYNLVFDTPILNEWVAHGTKIGSHNYAYIWGGSEALLPMYRETNPDMVLSKYIPFCRDPEARSLAWWQEHHPSWVLYTCDKTTPAGLATDPELILDISNPDVIDWQIQNYALQATNMFEYDYIAADNFALGNAVNACGIWDNGVWKRKYIGVWWDAEYTKDVLYWLKTFRNKLKQLERPMKLGINFVIMGQDPQSDNIKAVTNNVDAVIDEAGFTNWGEGKPDEERWLNILAYIDDLQANGKTYLGIHQFPTMNTSAENYAIASYLMGKNAKCSIMVSTIQGYGREPYMPAYSGLNTGSPSGKKFKSQGVWWRMYTGGLAVVNAGLTKKTVTLSGDTTYVDAQSNTYEPGCEIAMEPQSGLVLGIKGQTTAPRPTQKPTKEPLTLSTSSKAATTGSITSSSPSSSSSSSTGVTTSNPATPEPGSTTTSISATSASSSPNTGVSSSSSSVSSSSFSSSSSSPSSSTTSSSSSSLPSSSSSSSSGLSFPTLPPPTSSFPSSPPSPPPSASPSSPPSLSPSSPSSAPPSPRPPFPSQSPATTQPTSPSPTPSSTRSPSSSPSVFPSQSPSPSPSSSSSFPSPSPSVSPSLSGGHGGHTSSSSSESDHNGDGSSIDLSSDDEPHVTTGNRPGLQNATISGSDPVIPDATPTSGATSLSQATYYLSLLCVILIFII